MNLAVLDLMLQNEIYFFQAHRFGEDELSHSFRFIKEG